MREDDAEYLRNKWRPAAHFNLVEMDVSTDEPTARVIGHYDRAWQGGWYRARGVWLDRRTMQMTFSYRDYLSGTHKTARLVGAVSDDILITHRRPAPRGDTAVGLVIGRLHLAGLFPIGPSTPVLP